MTDIITYAEMKDSYEKFKAKPPKDAYSRLVQELKYLKNLKKMANAQKLEQDLTEYEKREKEVTKELTDMGYTVI